MNYECQQPPVAFCVHTEQFFRNVCVANSFVVRHHLRPIIKTTCVKAIRTTVSIPCKFFAHLEDAITRAYRIIVIIQSLMTSMSM